MTTRKAKSEAKSKGKGKCGFFVNHRPFDCFVRSVRE